MRLGAVILAGGRSVRMGRPKEWLPFGNEPLLVRTCRVVAGCADPVLVVARDVTQHLPPLPPEVELLTDERREAGPLAGLVQGMRHLVERHRFDTRDAVLLTGCDQPFLTTEFLAGLTARLDEHSLVMPRRDGHLQPLAAVYRFDLLPAATRLLASGSGTPRDLAAHGSVRVLDGADLEVLDPDGNCLGNVNTPEEYERALAWWRRQHGSG
ncbi:MAG: molybdenum cofactor guanylyltransferase [Planctomycetota bacterium]